MSIPISADLVLRHFHESERKHRRLRDVPPLLAALCEADTLRARLAALERLVRWVTTPDAGIPGPPPKIIQYPREWRRLDVTLSILEQCPEARAAVLAALAAIFEETEGLGLLAETGLPNDRGIYSETTDRLFGRLLPSPRDEHNLAKLIVRLFPSEAALGWVEAMPAELFSRAGAALGGNEQRSPWRRLLTAAEDAFCLLGARAQALGLSEDIRARGREQPVRDSPFFRLPRSGDEWLSLLAHSSAERIGAERQWRADVAGCRDEVRVVYERLEETGISIDVVYGLEVIEQILTRMEVLGACLAAVSGPERVTAVHRLLALLVRAGLADMNLRDLARANLRLLARKIIERAGVTGEHYITASRREYFNMLASASGGGFLTAGTAALKLAISVQHFPLFVEGFLSGVNYALSFIVMHVLGFTLATKQPSMTGATLAGVLRGTSGAAQIEELVTQVARIIRSQLAAAMGNIMTVSVACLALDGFWRWRFGHSVVGIEKATHVVESLHPAKSLTIWYAIITGVILWLSSLAAGWIENFAVYRRIPQAIAEHRLGRWLGEGTMRHLSVMFARGISGVGGSAALGFMLGMAPVLGQFFGLPIDVRHVTLSTGTLVLAALAHGWGFFVDPRFLWALAGIGVIFVCNLGVSFNLALAVALRAREVAARGRTQILLALVRRFLRAPREFLLPPRADSAGALPLAVPRGH